MNSTIWKNYAFENLAILKNEHIDNYLNYLYAFPTSYMWYFVSKLALIKTSEPRNKPQNPSAKLLCYFFLYLLKGLNSKCASIKAFFKMMSVNTLLILIACHITKN